MSLVGTEGVTDLGEETTVPRAELARGTVLTTQLGELAEQCLLLLVQLAGCLHVHTDAQVSTTATVEVRDTLARQVDDVPGTGARTPIDVLRTVEGVEGEGGTECGRRHRNGDGAVEGGTPTFECRVWIVDDLQADVTARPHVGTDLALTGEWGEGPVGRSRGDLDGAGDLFAHPAFARAVRARVGDDRPLTGALRTGTGGHHLPQEGTRHLGDLALAMTHVARGTVRARGRALALTGLAQDRGGEGDLLADPERGLHQVQLDTDLDAATTPHALAGSTPTGLTTAEERVHDVVERKAPGAAETAGTAARGERILPHVEHPTLALVGEDLVGLSHFFEALLGSRVRVDVRLQLARKPPVRLLDLVLGCVATRPGHLVIVSGHGVIVLRQSVRHTEPPRGRPPWFRGSPYGWVPPHRSWPATGFPHHSRPTRRRWNEDLRGSSPVRCSP